MLKVIDIEELSPGMFVNQVAEQKGMLKIKSRGIVKPETSIQLLKNKGILKLEIDLSKSKIEQGAKPESDAPIEELPIKQNKKSDGESLSQANAIYHQAKDIQQQFFDDMRTGQGATLQSVQDLSADILDSVFENSNALSCLTQIKNKDEYFLEHSLNCSILMALFAKHMGFDKALIEELCLGGLVMDTGMVSVPDDILAKKGKLSANEWGVVMPHVDFGIEMLEQAGELSDNTLHVVANHHERLDGSGYPEGKAGESITTYGRMAAIVDTYDALTSDRPYRAGMTPTNAMKKLLADSSAKLDQNLVQQFIKCLGVHPVGSLVKLKSGKLAIVVQANPEDPLNPCVYCFYSVNSGNYSETKRVDLTKSEDEIETCVRPDEFKINLNKFFKEIFLNSIS